MKSRSGVSSAVGVILVVAIVVALVSLVSIVVFDTSGSVDAPPDATVSMGTSNDNIDVTVLRNENVDNLVIIGPSNFTREISEIPGSSDSITAPEFGKYSLIAGSESDGTVIDSVTVQKPDTSTVSGTLQINPNIPDGEIISKDSNGRIIDTTTTDSAGNFAIESTDSGTLIANVEGFSGHSSIPNIDNDLYASKQVSVPSVENDGVVQFTADSSNIKTLSNSAGSKVDVLFESNNSVVQVGNPWQLKASKKLSGRDLRLINDIDTDEQSFVSFNNDTSLNDYPGDIDKSNNQITGISELSITWINVGQADSILIQSENGDNMLIDTGNRFGDAQRTLDYLDNEGINKIDHLVASHQDADHIGGHEAVIQEFGSSGIGNIYDNNVTRTTATEEDYLNAALNQGLTITPKEEGDTIPFNGATVEVLNPVEEGGTGSDNNMLVMKITHGDNAMFFGGDIEADTGSESRIVDSNQGELDVEVMDVPHHGSSTSSSNKLLNALSPEIAVISAPFDSQFGHPTDGVVNRYESRNVDLFWTAANGNVTVTSDGSDVQTSVEKGDVNDVTKDPNYEISVQGVDSSVEQGSTANVQVGVSNNGNVPDIQDIEMDVLEQNNPVDQKDNVKLTESESTSISLSWDTTGSEAKDYTVTVSSEDDTISRDISVTGGTGDSNNPTSDTLQSPSFESTGGWDFSDTKVQRSESSDPSFDGDFSASMKDLTQGYNGRILNSNSVSVTDDEYYNAEIYYNIQPSDGGTRDGNKDRYSVEVAWFDSSSNELSVEGVNGDFSSSDGWNEVSFSEQSPSNAESAKLRIRAKEGGSNDPDVYWDSASLTEFSNQLSNPSFESTGSWDFSSTGVQRSESSDPSFDGDFSASMKDLTQSYDGRILKSDSVSVTGGNTYQIGAYYNIQSPSRDSNLDEYSVDIIWSDSSGGEIDTTTNFADFPTTGGSWAEVSFSEKAPSDAESAKLRIRAKEGGSNNPTVYWDSAFIKG